MLLRNLKKILEIKSCNLLNLWLFSIDASDSKYAPFHKNKELLNLNFGNFDDSFMCSDWDGYNWSGWQFFGLERYKKGVAGGEFSYYTDSDQKHALDKEGMHGRKFEDLVAKVHMTFIIGNDQPGKQTDARITEAAMSMGYRFEIRDFCVNPGKSASVLIANVGVAPIYRDAWVAVEGVRGSFNLRGCRFPIANTGNLSVNTAKLQTECRCRWTWSSHFLDEVPGRFGCFRNLNLTLGPTRPIL